MNQLRSHPEAYNLYKGGDQQNQFGNFIGYPSGFYVGYSIGRKIRGDKIKTKFFIPALLVGIGSMVANVKGKGKMKKALQLYNAEKLKSKSYNFKWEGNKLVWYF